MFVYSGNGNTDPLTLQFRNTRRQKMGAWGIGPFENDEGLDVLDEIIDAEDSFAAIETALCTVTDTPEQEELIVLECAGAIVSGELLAAYKGLPSPHLTESVAHWVADLPTVRPDLEERLTSLAIRAVTAVLYRPNSDLRGLWRESGKFRSWLELGEELLRRLKV